MYYVEEDHTDPELPWTVKYDHRDGYARLEGRFHTREEAQFHRNKCHGSPFIDFVRAA